MYTRPGLPSFPNAGERMVIHRHLDRREFNGAFNARLHIGRNAHMHVLGVNNIGPSEKLRRLAAARPLRLNEPSAAHEPILSRTGASPGSCSSCIRIHTDRPSRPKQKRPATRPALKSFASPLAGERLVENFYDLGQALGCKHANP